MYQTFARILFASILINSLSWASNYPPEYYYQKIYALHDGPALFARISSGAMNAFVIGYKRTGYLSKLGLDSMDAIVIGQCETEKGSYSFKKQTVHLDSDWSGSGGYISMPLNFWNHLPSECRSGTSSLSIAFSDGHGMNLWDSRYGENYNYSLGKTGEDPRKAQELEVRETGSGMNEKAWKFITDQMKEK
jgi:hypothetical protein